MMRTAVVAALAAAFLVGSTLPVTANPPRKWWQTEEFQKELGLTAQQSNDIEAIFQATLPRLRKLKTDLDAADAVLSGLIAAPNTAEEQVTEQVNRVEGIRSDLSRTRTLMLFRMHRVLSPEQRDKLKALHEEHRRRPEPSERHR
jgi:Spy/CpxP family protein refolding chaperone